MLPKSRRLSAREVSAVLKAGKSRRAGGVSVKYLPSPRGKAAMVVSKKVARLAVTRNRLRRAGYAALPSALPPVHAVFFIQQREFKKEDILSLCSMLS